MTEAEKFFYEHAGWSYKPGEETSEQGRRRSASELAKAERLGEIEGFEIQWNDDWAIGSHVEEFGTEVYETEPENCEYAVLRDRNGRVLASLSCIDDATPEYRRVVEAELASEALYELSKAGC